MVIFSSLVGGLHRRINGVRGNIFAEDVGADRVNEHGANYIKGPRFVWLLGN